MYLLQEIEIVKKSEEEYFIINLTNGALDLINKELCDKIKFHKFDEIDSNIISILKERNYIFNNENDYLKYINNLDKEIKKAEQKAFPNFLLIPSYNCNLNCIYCYEHTYEMNCKNRERDLKLVENQYDIINNIVKSYKISKDNYDKIRITIMGGEPLLIPNKQVVEKIIYKANELGFTVDIVTNGIDLDAFINILKNKSVRNIQITLDGPKEIHDRRRIFFDGKGSFEIIIKNLELALKNNIEVYVRVNVDNENIDYLTKLADIFEEKFANYSNLHPYIYLLQDGGCSGENNVVKEEVGLKKLYELQKKNINLRKFYIKSHIYPLIKSIITNQPFNPRLKHCGASGNQFILDEKLLVYKCWHGIGNEKFSVGKYSENGLNLNKELINNWMNRDVTILEKCKKCKYRYVCGTGCPAATHKKCQLMDTSLPFCSNYRDLLETSLTYYFGDK